MFTRTSCKRISSTLLTNWFVRKIHFSAFPRDRFARWPPSDADDLSAALYFINARPCYRARDGRIKLLHARGREDGRGWSRNGEGWNYREFSRAASRVPAVQQTPSKIVESVLKPPLHRTSGQPSNEFHVYTPCFEPCVCVYALLVLLESVRPVDYDKCCRGKL